MQQTAVFPAMPFIRRDLHTSTTWATWIFSAYLLVTVAATAVTGRLADQFGKRRLLLLTLSIFFAGSIVAALAPNIAVLIFARSAQAAGASTIPLAIAVVRDTYPPEKVGGALGAIFGMLALGTSFGVTLGGIAVDQGSWRLIFAFAVVSVGVALLLVWKFVPESLNLSPARLDIAGCLLLSGSLAAFLLGLTEAHEWGWGSLPIVALFVGSAVTLFVWVQVERRVAEPMIDMEMLTNRTFALANVAGVLANLSMFAPLVVLPIFLSLHRGLSSSIASQVTWGFGVSATAIGLTFLPGFVVALGAGPVAARLAKRFGTRIPLALGMTTSAVGCLTLALFNAHIWEIVLGITASGIGQTLSSFSAASLVMGSVGEGMSGIAAGVHQVIRTMGAAISAQVGGALLAADVLAGTTVPTHAAFVHVFLMCAGGAICGFAVAWRFGPHEGRPEAALIASPVTE
jgi:MFS family permease